MRIDKVTIKHIASHKATTVDLAGVPVSVLFGENGAGKTPTARAVELLLRGGVTAFEGSRAHPLKKLIRRGEDSGEVEGVLVRAIGDKPVTLSRRLTTKGVETRVDGKTTDKTAFDFFLPAGVREPDAVLRVLAQTDSFFELADDVQKALLGALVDQAIPPELVHGLPLERLESFTPTIAGIDLGYDAAYQLRKNAKARLGGLRSVPDPGETEKPDLAEIQTKLDGLREEERTLLAGASTTQGARRTLEDERERQERRHRQAQGTLDDLGPAEAVKARLEAIGTELRTVAETQARRAQLAGELSRLKDELTKLEAEKKAPAPPAGKCPLAADARCSMSTAGKKTAETARNERITSLKTEISKRERELPTVTDTAALDKERARLEHGQGRRVELTRERDEARTRIDTLTQQLLEAPAISSESESLTALRARIQKGEQMLSGARELVQRIDAYAAYAAQRQSLQEEVDDLEKLCDALGPKGVKEKLIAARLGALQTEVNRILGAFGLQVEYIGEPWEVRVNGSSGPQMGKAEAFRAGVAHQVALAHVTGVRWLQVDGMDILDAGNRSAFFGVLDFAVSEKLIDQAIVYATYTRPPGPSPVPWARYFLVEYAGDSSVVRPITAKAE